MARAIDITGKRFGRLVVIERMPNSANGSSIWLCACDCGRKTRSRGRRLQSGESQSCGCGSSAALTSHGLRSHEIYGIWKAMVRRCSIAACPEYADYGGRGIRVCERWRDVRNFIQDMHPRPSPLHSLDRIDNDAGYSPSNCRWSTRVEQANNTRANRKISFRGETRTLAEWQRATGLGSDVIRGRLRMGWTVERALTEGVQ